MRRFIAKWNSWLAQRSPARQEVNAISVIEKLDATKTQ